MTKPYAGLVLALALAAISPSSAQTIGFAEAIDRLAVACGADIDRYCKTVNLGGNRIRDCLTKNQAKVSAQCKTGFAEAVALLDRRIAAQAAVAKTCTNDARRLCLGVKTGDGRFLDCLLKAERAVSDKCNQAITDAGYR